MTKEHAERPIANAARRMIRLLDRFENEGSVCIPTGMKINGQDMFRDEHPAISDFVRLAYEDAWMLTEFDWSNWKEGREIASDIKRISECDLLAVRKLITALVRNDRFCEGSLQSAFESGTIQAILRRVRDLDKKEWA